MTSQAAALSTTFHAQHVALNSAPRLCRLEQEPDVIGDAALQRFDPRLLRGLKALRQDGWWEELVNSGGSPVPLMELPSSNPGAEVLRPLGAGLAQGRRPDGSLFKHLLPVQPAR